MFVNSLGEGERERRGGRERVGRIRKQGRRGGRVTRRGWGESEGREWAEHERKRVGRTREERRRVARRAWRDRFARFIFPFVFFFLECFFLEIYDYSWEKHCRKKIRKEKAKLANPQPGPLGGCGGSGHAIKLTS